MNFLLSMPSAFALALLFWQISRVVKKCGHITLLFYFGLFGVLVIDLSFHAFSSYLPEKFIINIMYSYYAFALVSTFSYLAVSMQSTNTLNQFAVVGLSCTAIFTIVILLIPGVVLAGVEPIRHGYTRIAGPFYWVIQVSLVSTILIGAGILLYSSIKSKSWIIKRQSAILLMGSLGLAFSIIAVVVLMQLGFRINALIVAPIAIILLLSVQIYAEYEKHMFKLLSFIPFCSEYKLSRGTIDSLLKYYSGDLQGAVNEFERAVIQDVLDKCHGNKSAAAEKLKISRTTLRRKLESCEYIDDSEIQFPN